MKFFRRYLFKSIKTFSVLILFWFYPAISVNSQGLFFEKVSGQTEEPLTSIHGIARDSLSYMWFGSWDGLYRYNGNDFIRYYILQDQEKKVSSNRIRNVVTDDNGQLYVLNFDKDVFKYNYRLEKFEYQSESSLKVGVSDLLLSSSNKLNRDKSINGFRFFLSSNKLISENLSSGEEIEILPDLSQPGSLHEEFITSFFIDDKNYLWLGTRNGNIYKANTKRNPFYLHRIYRSDDPARIPASVRAVTKNKDQLWLGTNAKGIVVYGERETSIRRPDYIPACKQEQIRSLLEDKKGHIWIGGLQGLEYYDPVLNSSRFVINETLDQGLGIYSVYTLFSKGDNYLWAGLYNGIARIDHESMSPEIFDLSDLIGNRSVMALIEDSQGNIWIGTEGNGVFRFRFNASGFIGDTLHYYSDPVNSQTGLSGNLVYSLCEGNSGEVWVGTSQGLNCIDTNSHRVTKYFREDGLTSEYISSMEKDDIGNIWIANKRGISQILAATHSIISFGIMEEHTNWVFLDGASYYDSISNTCYFGCREGYVSFKPEEIIPMPFDPELLFSELFISGQKVNINQEIEGGILLDRSLALCDQIDLHYNSRSFVIALDALQYGNQMGVTYYYMVEGLDDTWQHTSHPSLTFIKVPPGKYVLKVKAATAEGSLSREKALTIRISGPWYTTWWMIGIYTVVTVLVGFFIFKEFQMRQKIKKQLYIEKVNAEKQEELNKEKLEFFTNVSHEIKTPLTLIVDPIEQIQKDDLSAQKKSIYLDIITKNVKHLKELIDQILDFRKYDSENLFAHRLVIDGISVIDDCVKKFRVMAENRNITLLLDDRTGGIYGSFDQDKLRQIILNLLSNALKYTPDGGAVTISVASDQNNIVVLIKDNGVGISKEALQRIFEPFNNEGSKPFYGRSTGMGLALTKKQIDLLGGQIAVQSEAGVGTEIKVLLPFTETIQQTIAEIYNNPNERNEIDSESTKADILIVEDNTDLRDYLYLELNKDYIVYAEKDGLAGFQRALGQMPDLIVSDVMMPEMDGIKLCGKLKNDERTSHIPVILLTAKDAVLDRVQGLTTGADAYIPKPFNMGVLIAQIESILQNRKRLQDKFSSENHISRLEQSQDFSDNKFLKRAIEIVGANLDDETLNPEKLSSLLHISQRQLYRKLKAVTGSAVQEFITRVRMDRASVLLHESDFSISEIAYKVGFTEPSNFSRTFSRQFNCSPTEYRKYKSSN